MTNLLERVFFLLATKNYPHFNFGTKPQQIVQEVHNLTTPAHNPTQTINDQALQSQSREQMVKLLTHKISSQYTNYYINSPLPQEFHKHTHPPPQKKNIQPPYKAYTHT